MGNRAIYVSLVGLFACSSNGDEHTTSTAQAVTTCVTYQRGVAGTVSDAMLSTPPAANNFGSQPIVRVGGKDEGLFRFALDAIPPTAAIDRATLTLYVNGDASGTPLALHRVTAPWAEANVSFASFAQAFDPAAAGYINPTSANAFKSVDVTNLVRDWVGGNAPNYGLAIETSSQKKTIFVSSEGTVVAQRPALQICYTTQDDHCAAAPCQNGGTCTNDVNGYTCSCPAGYTGDRCETVIDNCTAHPCQNGGTCQSNVGGYACTCAADFTGNNCETAIDDCAASPCGHGQCTDGVNSYTCTCDAGYTGTNCDVQIDDCAAQPCQNGGSCADLVNGYECTCATGYEGHDCEILIDHCIGNQCQNGATCRNEPAGYTCACAPGYGGALCEQLIDNCAGHPCLNGGTCTNGINTYTCGCANGYAGPNCEIDVNDCSPGVCGAHGTCVDGVASYSCACDEYWYGAACDQITPEDLCRVNNQLRTLTGSYTITDAASVSNIACVTAISGTLTINANSSLATVDLPVLHTIGALTVTADSRATSVKLAAVTSISGLTDVEQNPYVHDVDLGALTGNGEIYVFNNASLTKFAVRPVSSRGITFQTNPLLTDLGPVGLGQLTSVTNDLHVFNNALLASLGPNGLSSLVSVRGLHIQANPKLASLGPTSLAALTTGTGLFDVEQNPLLTTIDARNANLVGLWVASNAALTTLNLGNLPSRMNVIVLAGSPQLTDIGPRGFSTVTTVTNDFNLSGNALASIDLSGLQTVGGNMFIDSSSQLTQVDLSALQAVGTLGGHRYLELESNPRLASVDVHNALLPGLYCAANPLLTKLLLGPFMPSVSYAVIAGSPVSDLGPTGLSTLVDVNNELNLSGTKLANLGPTGLANLRHVVGFVSIVGNSELTTLGSLVNFVSEGVGSTGYFELSSNAKLTSVDLGNAQLAGWYIGANPLLTTFRFNSSRGDVSYARIDGPNLTDIGPTGYSNLTSVRNELWFVAPQMSSLGATGLSNLVSVGRELYVKAPITTLGPTSLQNVTSIGYYLEIDQTHLAAIDVRNATIGALWIVDNPSLESLRIDTPVTSMVNVNISNNPSLANLGSAGIGSLTTVAGDIRIDRSLLTSFGAGELASLTKTGGVFSIGHSNFASIYVPSLTSVGGDFEFFGDSSLTSVSAPLLKTIGNWLWIDVNPMLTSLSLPAVTSISKFRITNNVQLPGGCFTTLRGQLTSPPSIVDIGNNLQTCP
ncbi:MAG TPA: DNRLRE domain-containing protein [Kofleriaceae bacterium]|nr:DNRLRE domain-containing protein [Kofleriaceae bacterium]